MRKNKNENCIQYCIIVMIKQGNDLVITFWSRNITLPKHNDITAIYIMILLKPYIFVPEKVRNKDVIFVTLKSIYIGLIISATIPGPSPISPT